jgi:hypothetical protein
MPRDDSRDAVGESFKATSTLGAPGLRAPTGVPGWQDEGHGGEVLCSPVHPLGKSPVLVRSRGLEPPRRC